MQWVVALSISQDQKTLLAVTHEGVHVISLNLRSEINFLLNGHKSSITRYVYVHIYVRTCMYMLTLVFDLHNSDIIISNTPFYYMLGLLPNTLNSL